VAANSGPGLREWHAEQPCEATADLLRGTDAVIHAAAHVPPDQLDPSEARPCVEINALGTLNLLRACELARVPRFIFVSGANVLKTRARPVREDDPVGCEHAPYYLGSKLLAEVYVRAAAGTRTLIVRPSSIYGPEQKRGVLVAFAARLRAGEPVTLRDGGRHQADFVWVEDVAAMLVAAIASSRTGVVNLGSGRARTLLEATRILQNLLHAEEELVRIEPAGSSRGIAGYPAIDIARARRWFDYKPIQLEEGLRRWQRSDE
jgi:ADP-L-glycero-D-manno-heptose 6-epimerase